ncbi:NrfD/PsrC family molybdoenzyme membrane anchor subunit [Chloroflexota bacterium]
MEIQQKPFEWMIKYTLQKEWIQGRGVLVWIAEVFTSLGAGLYLVSLFFNNLAGLFIAWLIIVLLKIPIHIAYFGKPLRFWRTIAPFNSAWKTSWFSRGVTATVLFTGFGFLVILFLFQPSAAILSGWFSQGLFTGLDVTFRILAGLTVFLVGIYGGFIMNFVKGIPFWNTGLLPTLFIIAGINDGFALIMAIGLGGGQVDIMAAEIGSRVLLIFSAFIIITYLWSQNYSSTTAKATVQGLLKGYLAVPFWIGIVLFGIIIPIVISAVSYFSGELSSPLLIIAITFHTLSAFALKYVLLKAGVYEPLLPSASTQPTSG